MHPAAVFIGPGLREGFLRASFHETPAPRSFKLTR